MRTFAPLQTQQFSIQLVKHQQLLFDFNIGPAHFAKSANNCQFLKFKLDNVADLKYDTKRVFHRKTSTDTAENEPAVANFACMYVHMPNVFNFQQLSMPNHRAATCARSADGFSGAFACRKGQRFLDFDEQ